MEDRLVRFMDSIMSPCGFESYPLQIQWYNEKVTSHFQFGQLDPETLAFVILSVPSMFENSFLPFLSQQADCLREEGGDLLDDCMRNKFKVLIAARVFTNRIQFTPCQNFTFEGQFR